MEPPISSKELLTSLGLRSAITLRRWRERGLIPPPDVGTHPSGRGKISYWPRWVLGRCQEIRHYLKCGLSLEEIRQRLGQDWTAVERKWKQRYASIVLADQLQAANEMADEAVAKINAMVGQINGELESKIRLALTEDQARRRLFELMSAGFSPVLAVAGTDVSIVPDAVACRSLASSVSVIAVPLFMSAKLAFERWEDWQDKPHRTAVAAVEDAESGRKMLVEERRGRFEVRPMRTKKKER
jgi:DNA-binding transcriptional MerR regulator